MQQASKPTLIAHVLGPLLLIHKARNLDDTKILLLYFNSFPVAFSETFTGTAPLISSCFLLFMLVTFISHFLDNLLKKIAHLKHTSSHHKQFSSPEELLDQLVPSWPSSTRPHPLLSFFSSAEILLFLAMQWTNDKQMLWHICRISTSGSGHIKGHLIIWQYGASVQDQVDIITRLLSLVLLSWGIRLYLWSEQGIFGAVRTTFSHPCNCSAIRKQPFRLGNPQASSIWPLNFHELRHFWWIVIFFQKAQIWPF